jgi:hypothetical protein
MQAVGKVSERPAYNHNITHTRKAYELGGRSEADLPYETLCGADVLVRPVRNKSAHEDVRRPHVLRFLTL